MRMKPLHSHTHEGFRPSSSLELKNVWHKVCLKNKIKVKQNSPHLETQDNCQTHNSQGKLGTKDGRFRREKEWIPRSG